jgi:3-phytase
MRYWFLFLALGACAHGGENLPAVHAAAETAPVGSMDDAADDPAIWINRNDPAASLILGTDKQAGLYVYDLSGAVKQFTPAGELNNVDLRQNRRLGDFSGDIAAASNRSDNTVALFSVNGDGAAPMGAFPSAFPEPYGLCMGAWGEDTLVFVTHKTGDLVMYRLTGTRSGEETGRLKFKSQLEGCVFDDETGALFIGEEARGVWKTRLAGGALEAPRLIGPVGGTSGVKADVEGLALYKTGPNAGYLIASSQGNNSYAVYEFGGDNAFLGRFAIRPGAAIDGAEETDGIEATSMALGPDYPRGVLAVQDGYNDPQGSAQNYKIVDWRDIENALGLE